MESKLYVYLTCEDRKWLLAILPDNEETQQYKDLSYIAASRSYYGMNSNKALRQLREEDSWSAGSYGLDTWPIEVLEPICELADQHMYHVKCENDHTFANITVEKTLIF